MLMIGQSSLTCFGVQPVGVDAVELVGADAAHGLAHVAQGVGQVHHAALAEQEVVFELLRQDLPQLERVLVDRRALVPQVVGPDDRGVPGHVAAGQPALFQHGDVGHPVVLGQVVGGGQTVSAAADDHDVVGGLGVRIAPEEVRVLRQLLRVHWALQSFLLQAWLRRRSKVRVERELVGEGGDPRPEFDAAAGTQGSACVVPVPAER